MLLLKRINVLGPHLSIPGVIHALVSFQLHHFFRSKIEDECPAVPGGRISSTVMKRMPMVNGTGTRF
jgi:hypothetical protein